MRGRIRRPGRRAGRAGTEAGRPRSRRCTLAGHARPRPATPSRHAPADAARRSPAASRVALAATLLAGLGAGAPGAAAPAPAPRRRSSRAPSTAAASTSRRATTSGRRSASANADQLRRRRRSPIANRSGAAIDRLELNTVLARIGALRISARRPSTGVAVRPASTTRRSAVPLGGVLPRTRAATVRLAFSATLRARLDGSRWLFTAYDGIVAAYRWIPWVSRPGRFDRPTTGIRSSPPSSPRVRADRDDRPPPSVATTGAGVGPSTAATMVVRGDQRARPRVRRRPGLPERPRPPSATRASVVYARPRLAGPPLLREASRALARLEAASGPYP